MPAWLFERCGLTRRQWLRGDLVAGLAVRRHVQRLLMPLVGVAIAALAIGFAEATGKSTSMVLFSGQDQMGPLLGQAAGWSVGTLLLLIACKSLAYSASLSSFRGGPVFPSMFIGAAARRRSRRPARPPRAARHHRLAPPRAADGAAVAMGIGAMCCTMLTLPLTSTLLATLLLGSDGTQSIPVVIVAYVVTARLKVAPEQAGKPDATAAEAPAQTTAGRRASERLCRVRRQGYAKPAGCYEPTTPTSSRRSVPGSRSSAGTRWRRTAGA